MPTPHSSTAPVEEFPQVHSGLTIERLLSIVSQAVATATLPGCCYQTPESSWGACDGGFPCYRPATVHHLASEQDYCARHYYTVAIAEALTEVERG